MNESPADQERKVEYLRKRVQLARLEADLAYFQARLEILREPKTTNQLAQRTAFSILRDLFSKRILGAREKVMEERRRLRPRADEGKAAQSRSIGVEQAPNG